MDKNYWLAIAMMVGTIVGVGMFGLPYVVAQAGFFVGMIYLAVLTFVVVVLHLSYGEIILRTNEENRFVGFAQKYLGGWSKKLVTFSMIFGLYGGQIAYIIVGGSFLAQVFSFFNFNIDILYWQLIFFVLGAMVVLSGLKMVAKMEFYMSGFLILVIILVLAVSFPQINLTNFSGVNLKNMFMPYGVIMFSLAGSIVIPEVIRLLKGNNGKIKKAIILGTGIPAILYGVFILAVVGVVGIGTTSEPTKDLIPYLGNTVPFVGAIFGFLACYTSYIIFGEGLKKMFQLDYNIDKFLSWLLAMAVPLIGLVGLGFNNFIPIIGLVGAVFGGIDNILLLLILRRAKLVNERKPEYTVNIPAWLGGCIIALFVLGALAQIIYWRI